MVTSSPSPSPSSSLLPPPKANEYDVVLLYETASCPLTLKETSDGEAAFFGYKTRERCSTIRNQGDVIVAIDNSQTRGMTFQQVIQQLKIKARSENHSFLRFRDPHQTQQQTSQKEEANAKANTEQPVGGQQQLLPKEPQRRHLQQELSHLDETLETKLCEVEALQEKIRLKRDHLKDLQQQDWNWLEQKQKELKFEMERHQNKKSNLEVLEKNNSLSAAQGELETLDRTLQLKRNELEQLNQEIQKKQKQKTKWMETIQQQDREWMLQIQSEIQYHLEECLAETVDRWRPNYAAAKHVGSQHPPEQDSTSDRICCSTHGENECDERTENQLRELMAELRQNHQPYKSSTTNQRAEDISQRTIHDGHTEKQRWRSFDIFHADFAGCLEEIDRALDYTFFLTHLDHASESSHLARLKSILHRLNQYLTHDERQDIMVRILADAGIHHGNYQVLVEEIQHTVQTWVERVGDRRGCPRLEYFCTGLKRVFDPNRRPRRAQLKPQEENDMVDIVEVVVKSGRHCPKCPITAADMEHPVRNTMCGHLYSRSGIKQLILISGGRHCVCPIAGCTNRLVTLSQVVPVPNLDLPAEEHHRDGEVDLADAEKPNSPALPSRMARKGRPTGSDSIVDLTTQGTRPRGRLAGEQNINHMPVEFMDSSESETEDDEAEEKAQETDCDNNNNDRDDEDEDSRGLLAASPPPSVMAKKRRQAKKGTKRRRA